MIRRLYIVTVSAVTIGVILACWLFRVFYQLETTQIQRDFERDVDKQAQALSLYIEEKFAALHHLKLIVEYQGMPDREAFSGQAQSLLTRYPSLQSVGWVPWIPAAQRYAHESAQAFLMPEYRIVERVASDELVNATERADYFPLQHIASRTDNLTALGYDFGANAVQRRMLNQARDTGQWQLSERIERDVLPNTQGTVQVVVPVYDQVQPVTRMERRQALRGFIVGYWHIDEMIAPWFPLSSFAQMHLGIADLQANEATSLLFGLGDRTASSRTASSSTQFYLSALALEGEFVLLPEPSERVSRTVLAKGGREWVMEATPTAHYFEQRRTAYSFYVFGAILFGFVGLSGYGWRVMQRHVLQWNQLGENNQQLAEQNKSLVRLTRMDTLLGVANRRFFDETLHKEFSRAYREDKPLALLLIDIDHFKAFNDTYGHQAGDRCLKLVAGELERVLRRPADMLARVGGEEFGVILPNTNNGEVVARQCRTAVERLGIAHGGSFSGDLVTVSIGVISLENVAHHTTDSIYALADEALYEAKSSGRNCIRAKKVTVPRAANTLTCIG
ncbi:diguanylate cyclase domain-containing protein [Photobacterium aphoticum]|uniref:diguanylate cyclase n=1 Tax=Photobacterium aphoticum TaxID=754436 RepID=A0A0J1GUJ7_9GAMM|nr:diguanylate cyclase [Photobacterium aphoticum]KLV03109.1 hypothetical protein ABT58_00890 [Photobacterium aphoticum]PSU56517.1 hypothetical protein C9I90_12580 [Photobacterium aphoticum]GHA52051.1 hypothetical protein GCM10007086_27570 [Photobacterium aphoticum]